MPDFPTSAGKNDAADNFWTMDIVGGAYGGPDPEAELKATLEEGKSWLEGVVGSWEELSDGRKLEMVAASLLSLHRLQMHLETARVAPPLASDELLGLRIETTPERPNLVDLTLEERDGESSTRVKLMFRDQELEGRSPCRSGTGLDHAAPARATLEALEPVVDEALQLEDARVLQINDGPFAVVTLRSNDRLLVGSALIEDDLGLATARATLDAANRFIKGMSAADRHIRLG